MAKSSVSGDPQTILTVHPRLETLDHMGPVATALLGAGILNLFEDGGLVRSPAAVTCDKDQGGYAKKAFNDAGFDVPTPTEPAPAPPPSGIVTLTVKPLLSDTDYPLGAAESGMLAAKALCGAYVTQPIGSNGDPFDGDPGTSMQVNCYKSDLQRALKGFHEALFIASLNTASARKSTRVRGSRAAAKRRRSRAAR
jgi:hypothetical protein